MLQWRSQEIIPSKRFICGHCGSDITSDKGYYCVGDNNRTVAYLYICHHCFRPTLFHGSTQVPGAKIGNSVEHLPKDIDDLYQELRDATAANAYTAAVMAGRKLLMHIAVECGAEEGKKFVEYVNYLVKNHYAPPNSKTWVDKIRELGNEANHEIRIMGVAEASDIIKFIEMLLKFNYEFPQESAEPDTET